MDKVDKLIVLWNSTRDGEEKAFALLHKELYPCLFSYIVKMIKDEDSANDLLQDLFIKFWQNKLRIGYILNVKAYFYKSARSIVLNHIRSTQLKQSKLDAMPVTEFEFSHEELIIADEFDSELKGVILNTINKLPARQREVIHMHFFQNLEYTEIAEITGIKYQSVVNHIYRAVQVLREASSLSKIYAA
ncbi:MAG TPA: sigma-70 family RNA polymerase sigma factor [Pedobacter sp.]|uniref:RNA polymerase sigma factor n=1 Tax=Pedobacter sp. TaxID=1411316 RepID=UPI002C07AB78|nr:sigma-70 family RNA polymerase sigma factor [Pedobacter sp.]HMI05810.1 sigma-70 family RNA polymerase sigma factor [Pedobacter sp.]